VKSEIHMTLGHQKVLLAMSRMCFPLVPDCCAHRNLIFFTVSTSLQAELSCILLDLVYSWLGSPEDAAE